MSFRLTNAPSTFESLMNGIFRPHLRKFILVFFDGILVYRSSWTDHLNHLRIVLTHLRENYLFVKKIKMQLWYGEGGMFGTYCIQRWCGSRPFKNSSHGGLANSQNNSNTTRFSWINMILPKVCQGLWKDQCASNFPPTKGFIQMGFHSREYFCQIEESNVRHSFGITRSSKIICS